MSHLVDCSNCHTTLQVPPGARSIRCAICKAITSVAYSRPPPSAPPRRNSRHSDHSSASCSSDSDDDGPQSPPPKGRKKAVICAVSYMNTKLHLKGCLNDAKCMKYLLLTKFNFPESSILMLNEEETDPYRIPTKRNIQMAMYWLVKGCKPGDSLVFHFSGHGSQQKNHNGEELDGFDETLVPLDFETEGMILDDEINATLVKPLPRGVRLHAIMDCCHSGTALDLPYLCRMNRRGKYEWEDHEPDGTYKGTSGGEVISFSGCDDHQTSADTTKLSKVTATGALTFCFIQAIEHGEASTYGSILNYLRSTIGRVGGLTQEPQLTACKRFDVYKKRFYL